MWERKILVRYRRYIRESCNQDPKISNLWNATNSGVLAQWQRKGSSQCSVRDYKYTV